MADAPAGTLADTPAMTGSGSGGFGTTVEEMARAGRQVAYTVLEVDGPPHERTFTCAANIDGQEMGIGRGPSKKAAEQEAARQALRRLGVVPTGVT